MKLTWFGATTMRIHIGGAVIVTDAALAPDWVDKGELAGGADRLIALETPDETLPLIDPTQWRPRRRGRMIDDSHGPGEEPAVLRLGRGAVIVDAPGEPPLLLLTGIDDLRFGRWANQSVIVMLGDNESMVAAATVVLDIAEPRLLAIAADEEAVDTAIAELREHLAGVAFAALEPAMALEV